MKNNSSRRAVVKASEAVIASVNGATFEEKKQWILKHIKHEKIESVVGKASIESYSVIQISDNILRECTVLAATCKKGGKSRNVYLQCPFNIGGRDVVKTALLLVSEYNGTILGVPVDYDMVQILCNYTFYMMNRGSEECRRRIDIVTSSKEGPMTIEEIIWCATNYMDIQKVSSVYNNIHHNGYQADKRRSNIQLVSKEDHRKIHKEITQKSHYKYMYIGFSAPCYNKKLGVYDIVPALIFEKVQR